jgi:hypothetical protein
VKRLTLSKVLFWFMVTFVLLALTGGYMAYQLFVSPSATLRHALNIRDIPDSVRHLRMGSDLLPDEIRCFYFTIAPADFDQLLGGRTYQKFSTEFPETRRTIHISPTFMVTGHSRYTWETKTADCTIIPDDSHEHVIVIFSVD